MQAVRRLEFADGLFESRVELVARRQPEPLPKLAACAHPSFPLSATVPSGSAPAEGAPQRCCISHQAAAKLGVGVVDGHEQVDGRARPVLEAEALQKLVAPVDIRLDPGSM
jgi:hypothetical protein